MDSIIIFLFAGLIIIGLVLLAIIATTRKSPKGINQEEFRSKWLKIQHGLEDNESSRHMAIVNADKLLDQALKARGFKGDTMAERLKSAKDSLSHKDALWHAHKIRNRIVHEDTVTLSNKDTRQSLAAYKRALKDVGAL